MIITREKGMRMWGGGSGNTSVSGASSGGGFSLTVAEGEGTGNAYTDFTYESGKLTLNKATEFVTVDFFNKLFTAYDANGNVIAPNNTTPTLDNIKFKAGAWTEQYLSALGQNSSGGGGGGGGIELSDVWQSLKTNTDDYANQKINIAHIPDLSGTYATKTWVNQQGFVTSSGVTSVAMTVPTGLSVSGSPITSTGTLALTFATGYSIPTTAKQGNWDTAYGWGNHATAGYAMGTTSIIAGNGLTGGGTLAADRTLSIQLQTNSGLAVSSSGLKLDIINNLTTESAYKAISATQAKKIWDLLNQMFTLEGAGTTASPYVIKANYGLYTEQFLSALGQNSSGGGGGGIELSDVWQSLKTNTDDYANQKINIAHIPDLSGTYATKTWVNQQGFVTSSGVTSVAMTVPTGLSVSGSPITSTGTLALTFATGYSIPTTAKQGNWDTAYGWGNHASAGYASASSVSTLQGYFTNGVAKEAAKLSTVSKTAWGQTYWTSGGVPTNISGAMTGVGNITMDGYLYMASQNRIYFKSSGNTDMIAMYETAANHLYIGYGFASEGYSTYIAGNTVELRYGTSRTTGLTLGSDGNVTATGTVTAPTFVGSLSGNATTSSSCTGNAATATTLATSRSIWGQSFDGSSYVRGTLSMFPDSLGMNNDTAKLWFRANTSTAGDGYSPYIQGIFQATTGRKRLSVFQINNANYTGTHTEVFTILPNGRVGIGTIAPNELLEVSGNILASGDITASSDERKKNIISDTKFNVRDIASARSILYEWNDDRDKDNEKKIHGGSIAQDWLGKADSFLNQDNDGWYSINYGALALCSAITIAKEVVKHEDRITILEKENAKLKARVAELEERRTA